MIKSLDKKIKNKSHKILKAIIRTLIAIILIVVQIAMYLFIFFGLNILKGPFPTAYNIIYEIFKWFGVVIVLLLFTSTINQSYKFSWTFFILLCPFIGTVCYIMFGNARALTKNQTKKMKEFQEFYHLQKDTNLNVVTEDVSFNLIVNALKIDSRFSLYQTENLVFFNDAAKKGYIISKGSAGGNYTNTYFTIQNTLFSVGSTGGVNYQFSETNPMNVGVSHIPQASSDSKNHYTINQGPSLCVLDHNDANRTLASWLFYKFISNEENSLDWCLNTTYSPIRYSSLKSAEYLEAADVEKYDEKTLARLSAYSKAKIDVGNLYTSPAFKGSSTCRNQASGLMTKALTTTNNIEEIDQWFADAVAQCKLAL